MPNDESILSKTIACCFKSLFLQQTVRRRWFKLQKIFWQIFVKNTNLGNFAAVKILEETQLQESVKYSYANGGELGFETNCLLVV